MIRTQGFIKTACCSFAMKFSKTATRPRFCKKDGWNPFPLNRAAACLLYGGSIDGHYYGSYIDDIPLVKNGFWYFSDRQSPKTVYTEADIRAVYHRPSANFRIAVWDTEQNMLYYAAYDS